MIHPIFSVLISRPELVVDHVANYATLVRDEASSASGHLVRRIIAGVVGLICLVVFLVLAGVATMVGVMHGEFHWVLVAAPGFALVVAVIALSFAQKRSADSAFAELRSQLSADVNSLRSLGDKP